MLKIDRYAYTNRLAHVHPAEKVLLAGVTMVICIAFSSPVTSLLVLLLMTGVTVLLAKIPGRFFLRLMLVPASFLVVGTLTIALSFTKETPFLLYGVKIGGYMLGVTARGLGAAVGLFLKSLGAVACLYFLSLTTPVVEIFSVLKKLRLPPLFLDLMALVYRFIFVLLETADKMYTAQAARWGYATLKTSYFSSGQLISNLFHKSYCYSRMLFTTLLARCYTGELKVLEKPHVLSGKNLFLIAAAELALLVVSLWSRGFLGVAAR